MGTFVNAMYTPAAARHHEKFTEVHQHTGLTEDGVPLAQALKEFRDLGGTLQSVNSGAGAKFEIAARDHLFPVCMSGAGSSQVAHVLLRRVCQRLSKHQLEENPSFDRDENTNNSRARLGSNLKPSTTDFKFEGCVHPPHAADKLQPVDSQSEVLLTPTQQLDTQDGFRHAFGVRRTEIIGEDHFGEFFSEHGESRPQGDELYAMARDYFREEVYSPREDRERRVFFCFGESVHVVLTRLVQAARWRTAGEVVGDQNFSQKLSYPHQNAQEEGITTVDTSRFNAESWRSPLEDTLVVAVPLADMYGPQYEGTMHDAQTFKEEYERVEAMLAQKQAVQILERKSHHFAQ